jgi:O-glycosyl hydrolase
MKLMSELKFQELIEEFELAVKAQHYDPYCDMGQQRITGESIDQLRNEIYNRYNKLIKRYVVC